MKNSKSSTFRGGNVNTVPNVEASRNKTTTQRLNKKYITKDDTTYFIAKLSQFEIKNTIAEAAA